MKKYQPSSATLQSQRQPSPFEQLRLHSETLAGRKVVLVVSNVEFDKHNNHFASLTRIYLPGTQLSPISWCDFLNALPTLDADIIFISGMRNPGGSGVGLGGLKDGLRAFRGRNPKAVVVIANAHPHGSPANDDLHLLESMRLVDHVKHADVFSAQFLADGVELFARRQELQ